MTINNSDRAYVTFWGTRGSIPTPGNSTEKYGGNTPCVHIQHQDTDIILDAGTGIRNLGLELMQQERKLDLHLLLSHTHWDHIQGLPFFGPAYSKDTNIHIYGSPQKESFLAGILQRQMDINYFPVDMSALKATLTIEEIKDNKLEIGTTKVKCQEQICHPGGSLRYKVEVNSKKIVYATDVELDMIIKPDADSKHDSTKLLNEYKSFIKDADLLIADAQYTEQEYISKQNWGHSSIPVVLDIAHQQGVKQLALFHHDPQRSDAQLDKMWKEHSMNYSRNDKPMNVFWAREGMTLAI